ncbi:sigma-70 family RNA polymerase sigma factor [Deinococcus peraridilitoris]|nr:sigma-70 family RNA polymerase sigma factor [Deinococcus peraridilitoris]
MNPTDEQLIALMGHGQEDALRELHRRYAPYLFSMARRMLSGTDDVEACVQDAFVSVWKHAARFDPSRASAKTWLVTIAHRRFLQALRDRPDSTLPLEEWDAPTQSTQPLDRIMLQGALTQLDGEQQKLIELAFYDGYSHGQLAEVTGLPLGTVKTRLRAALSKLRTHLEDKRDA